MLLNTLVKDLSDADELRAQLVGCLEVPANERAARQKLEAFAQYADEQIAAGTTTARRIEQRKIKAASGDGHFAQVT